MICNYMKIFEYTSEQHYIELQIKRWKKKRKNECPESIYRDQMKDIIVPAGSHILCNGVRNSHEVKCFMSIYPGTTVIGTDIATKSNNIVKCDFSKLPSYLTGFDLIYSNSLDHSRDPIFTIKHWVSRLKPGGQIVVVVPINVPPTEFDPISFESMDEVECMFREAGLDIITTKMFDSVVQLVHGRLA